MGENESIEIIQANISYFKTLKQSRERMIEEVKRLSSEAANKLDPL